MYECGIICVIDLQPLPSYRTPDLLVTSVVAPFINSVHKSCDKALWRALLIKLRCSYAFSNACLTPSIPKVYFSVPQHLLLWFLLPRRAINLGQSDLTIFKTPPYPYYEYQLIEQTLHLSGTQKLFYISSLYETKPNLCTHGQSNISLKCPFNSIQPSEHIFQYSFSTLYDLSLSWQWPFLIICRSLRSCHQRSTWGIPSTCQTPYQLESRWP